MPRRALIEKRPWLLASIAAALAFYLLRDGAMPGAYQMLLKGAACAFLAIWAVVRHGGRDTQFLAAIMGVSALADMAIEITIVAGAALFLLAHIIAIALYLRHRRDSLTGSQKAASLALLVLTPLVGWELSQDPLVPIYAAFLGAMAASAWSSSFPRYRVGVGALLFVASDLLIFAREGVMADSALPGLLIWPLYYIGQLLIATGVIGTLRGRAGA